jgi:translocator protein
MTGAMRIAVIIGCILLCQAAGALGALTTQTGGSSWYQTLEKPSFNPPGWVFGPVWTLLYALMGIALFLLIRQWPGSRLAIILFAVQLMLNAAWTPVFFGAHQIGAALLVIVILWLAIAATMAAAWFAAPAASLLLAPYLLWVTFATVLNAAFWRLNP